MNGNKLKITKKWFKKHKNINYENKNPYDLNEVGGISHDLRFLNKKLTWFGFMT
jgi:hypothetical protein